MLKGQKGITLISLVITIIVTLILAGVTITTSIEVIDSSKVRSNITTMSLIKVEVEKIFEDFEFENDTIDMNAENLDISKLRISGATKYTLPSGTNMPIQSQMSDDEEKLILIDINTTKDSNSDGTLDVDVDNLWYTWTTNTLESLNIDYENMMTDGQNIIVNYATGEIIIPEGIIENDNGVIYSLTGLKELAE